LTPNLTAFTGVDSQNLPDVMVSVQFILAIGDNQDLTKKVENWIKESKIPEVTAVKDSGVVNASEDFAYYAQKKPACFFYVGCQPEDGGIYPHHSPKFMMNEDCLIICARSAASVISHYFA
ncbi:M20/M25/M40 family metallo-hydrolase, partial [Lactobacillus delbrueckii]|uniref:M20/M25/M40 family metallo-hydrolase n=1 Tax=Lactobacillus delbrueckii TaxID=1584 RepID=UPI0035D0D68A